MTSHINKSAYLIYLIDNEIEEIKEDNYFPNIFCNEKTEEDGNAYTAVETVPHKLPDLSNKYRKFLKESSSDDSDKNKNYIETGDKNKEADIRGTIIKEYEVDKNDNYDIFSNNVNRSRSMLNRFSQANNTADSRIMSKSKILPNSKL